MRVRVLEGLAGVSADAWDALTGPDDPFVEHAFLATLEESGSVSAETGWLPVHLTAWEDERLVGALPLYLKDHSFGEYIFDWGWADAAHRAGVDYYPKLVSMVPVTPATGRRFLVAEGVDRDEVIGTLAAGLRELADATDASSIHLLFLTDRERDAVLRAGPFMPRLSMQFHWHNEGYADFDDFLARLRAPDRKKVRRERRAVADAGVHVRVATGTELGPADWAALRRFYRGTCARKGSYPYLTDRFFELGAQRLRRRAVAVLAEREGRLIAGTLNFEKGQHLYGRYWGAAEEVPMLHFELCYYTLIERAIARGMSRFEAGAQGRHKLKRGMLPAAIHSAHWVRDERLRQAVAEFLPREAFAVQRQMAELRVASPFKRWRNAGG